MNNTETTPTPTPTPTPTSNIIRIPARPQPVRKYLKRTDVIKRFITKGNHLKIGCLEYRDERLSVYGQDIARHTRWGYYALYRINPLSNTVRRYYNKLPNVELKIKKGIPYLNGEEFLNNTQYDIDLSGSNIFDDNDDF
jgi:hypothetical protein